MERNAQEELKAHLMATNEEFSVSPANTQNMHTSWMPWNLSLI